MLRCFDLKSPQFTNKTHSPTLLSCQPWNPLLTHPGLVSHYPSVPVIAGPQAKPMHRDTCTFPESPVHLHSCHRGRICQSSRHFWLLCSASPASSPTPSTLLALQNHREHSSGGKQPLKERLETNLLSKTSPFHSYFSDSKIMVMLFSTFLETKYMYIDFSL